MKRLGTLEGRRRMWGWPKVRLRPGGVRNQGSVPEAPSLKVLGQSLQSIGKYCRITFVGGKAQVGFGREEPRDPVCSSASRLD